LANHLIYETSPYLLQHAHNPVNWYPWGDEALQKAKDEDKPVLVSIGYAACHWCHVMERESFEDDSTAAIMNEHFINIKIDREERPDIDHIYMDAVQAMTGSGGWPLNVFLTPDKQPFYGGTYFPPQPVVNRPSWKEVLIAVADAFKNKRSEIEQQANSMTEHLQSANSFGINPGADNLQVNIEQADIACANLLKQADKTWGGFGNAPKFPQTFSIQYLLRYYFTEKQRPESLAGQALQQALLSLDKMINGGIYDQAGGGFARYSTDKEWLAPHFEKMLYDNALLVSALSEAYQVTKKEKYKEVIEQTLEFIERELSHANGGFYAALDADSEGVEGKFYVWDYDEVMQLIGNDSKLFAEYYDVTPQGNWEGKNILRVLQPLGEFAKKHDMPAVEIKRLLKDGRKKLLNRRKTRIRPALDDKVILGWNALMNTAYSKVYAATGNDLYKQRAIDNMNFLLSAFSNNDGSLNHVWKNEVAKYPAFLDDYAYLTQALLELQKITGETVWLDQAEKYSKYVVENFSEEQGFFYYTHEMQKDVIVRKKEVYDGATPSGNAVMAQNLYQLGILLNRPDWSKRSAFMVSGISGMMVKYPTSFGVWLIAMLEMIKGTNEIVLMGEYESALKELLSQYLPHAIIMASSSANEQYPLLKNKPVNETLTFYLCRNYACEKPVFSIGELLQSLTD